ncbi:DNA polymerase/3'-5' exonuclease PolX [bacterium]|nr:DNA polymerase/3'-5' exonuclease PolX [bacterium]
MRNAEVATLLFRIASLLELQGGDRFRVGAYQTAARTIGAMGEDIADIWKEGRLQEIHGVGESIAAKISDFLEHGKSKYLSELEHEVPVGAVALSRVPGLGPKRAKLIAESLKIKSVTELIQEAEAHHLRDLPGMGARSEEQVLKEARRVTQRTLRLPLFVAWPLADALADLLREHPAVKEVEPAGSIRRRKETIGDIDLLVASHDPDAVFDHLATLPLVQEVLLRGPTKSTILTHTQLQVDVRVVPPETWGAALQYFTGSKQHNIHLRTLAIAKGYKVSEYGIFRVDTGARVGGATEAEIYETLGLEWMPPEIREDTGEIEAAALGRLPDLIALEDVRGDCHTHTRYSDGRDSLETMARAAMALGYGWIVITDHSYGLPVTTGLTEEKALKQRAEIARLNRELAPFRILQGVEVEIRSDGTLDFDDAFLAGFDWVGASLHVGTRGKGEGRNTARLVSALRDEEVNGLNHPTGRIVRMREPYVADFHSVIQTAARCGKTLEINGSERLDLPSDLGRAARDAGLDFTLSTDAHSFEQLRLMRYAVAIARRAWVEKQRVLNALEADALCRRLHCRLRGGNG